MFCSKCGRQNIDDAAFCTGCGSDLTKQTPPEKKYGHDSLNDAATSIQQDDPLDSFAVGSLFANRYEILDEGKRGGMGAVYKCRDTELNEIVAVKIIHTHLLNSQNALSRFRQEVAISRKLHHKNIVEVHDIAEESGIKYYTMDWVEGVTLRDIIQDRKKENKPFTLEETYAIISQLSDALQYAHQYTIHRDIKPENILVEGLKGQMSRIRKDISIKLTDFGIAKMLSPSDFTSTSIQMGTPYYMAPEQKVDAATVDKRADVYAIGVVLFELLTLENTIGPYTPSEINKDLPEDIDSVYKKAVSINPEQRYASSRDLSVAVNEVIAHERIRIESARRREEELKRQEKDRFSEETERKNKEEEDERKKLQEADRIRQEEGRKLTEDRLRKDADELEEEKVKKENLIYLCIYIAIVTILVGLLGYFADTSLLSF